MVSEESHGNKTSVVLPYKQTTSFSARTWNP